MGLGPPGLTNGVVLVMAEVTSPGRTQRVSIFAGTVVEGRPNLVLTVQHCISGTIKDVTGSVHGDVGSGGDSR